MSSKKINRSSATAFAMVAPVAAGLVWASAAWACTASAYVNQSLTPASGPDGTVVPIVGSQFSPGASVTIQFVTSAGSAGPVVASTTVGEHGNFDIPVTVPASTPPGYYAFEVYSSTTGVGPWPTPSFHVTASPSPSSSSGAGTGSGSAGGTGSGSGAGTGTGSGSGGGSGNDAGSGSGSGSRTGTGSTTRGGVSSGTGSGGSGGSGAVTSGSSPASTNAGTATPGTQAAVIAPVTGGGTEAPVVAPAHATQSGSAPASPAPSASKPKSSQHRASAATSGSSGAVVSGRAHAGANNGGGAVATGGPTPAAAPVGGSQVAAQPVSGSSTPAPSSQTGLDSNASGGRAITHTRSGAASHAPSTGTANPDTGSPQVRGTSPAPVTTPGSTAIWKGLAKAPNARATVGSQATLPTISPIVAASSSTSGGTGSQLAVELGLGILGLGTMAGFGVALAAVASRRKARSQS